MSDVRVQLEGQKELIAQLSRLSGPALRSLARNVVKTAMVPVLEAAKANAPVGPTGRLQASIGKLATTNSKGDAFSSRVGTRRDFNYTNVSGTRIVAARGKKLTKGLATGRTKDTKSAQQYARLIEFGVDSKGRMRRRAGPAHFLENAIVSKQSGIITSVSSQLRRFLEENH